MRRRGIYLVLVVLVAGGVLVGVFARRQREPEYGGKRLSEWVEELAVHAQENHGAIGEEVCLRSIQHVGKDGMPLLVRWARYERPSWKSKVYNLVDIILGRAAVSWRLTDRALLRADGAAYAIIALSPKTNAALEALGNLMNEPPGGPSTLRVGRRLVLGGESTLPALVAVLQHNRLNARPKAAWTDVIGTLGTNAQVSVPVLKQLLTDPDLWVRHCASNALRQIDPVSLVTQNE